MNELPV